MMKKYEPRMGRCENQQCRVWYLKTGTNSKWCPDCAPIERLKRRRIQKKLARIQKNADPEYTEKMKAENMANLVLAMIKHCDGPRRNNCKKCLVVGWCDRY